LPQRMISAKFLIVFPIGIEWKWWDVEIVEISSRIMMDDSKSSDRPPGSNFLIDW
jgi:hypothetical protein